ncbi:MAG TPA: CDP-alcohol phosphatidyltransferase family protein [Spirochaetota bacterium]|nr:CDP-alcohol phosphatidyltransferase family protein [Spirochaetota bacterium]
MKIRELFSGKVYTVSNFLTLLRVIAVPVIFYYMHLESITGNQKYMYYQVFYFGIVIVSDFFDGFLARKFNQISKLGQFLDPVADKICLIVIGSSLVYYKGFPLWVLIIVLFREVVVVLGAVFLFARRDVEVQPGLMGKTGVACMALSALFYLVSFDYQLFNIISVKIISVSLILLFYIPGSVLYVKNYSEYCFKDKKF